MALILSLETSGAICSAALHRDGRLIQTLQINEPQAHAARLAPLIRDLLQESSAGTADLEAVAISSGPGSYTGLRIGTSTAKGICFSLRLPLIAVSTLDLLASEGRRIIGDDGGLLCPMIDARRMEVYCQVTRAADLGLVRPKEARIIDEASFSELLPYDRMFFFGDGAGKCKAVLNHANCFFPEGINPSAVTLGDMAAEKFRKGEFEDLTAFVPLYLKEFEAKKSQPLF